MSIFKTKARIELDTLKAKQQHEQFMAKLAAEEHTANLTQPNYCPGCKKFTSKRLEFDADMTTSQGEKLYYYRFICDKCGAWLSRIKG